MLAGAMFDLLDSLLLTQPTSLTENQTQNLTAKINSNPIQTPTQKLWFMQPISSAAKSQLSPFLELFSRTNHQILEISKPKANSKQTFKKNHY